MKTMREKPTGRLCKMQGTLDGGLSWLIVLSSFIQQFIVLGTHNVFGLFYIDLLQEFKKGKAATGTLTFKVCLCINTINLYFHHIQNNLHS